jgi:hypothetical protein
MANTQTGTTGATSTTRGSTTSGTQAGMGGEIPDTTYNLISVLYHTLQGCQTYEQYAQDAEQAGQQDIAQFFRKTARELEECAQEGKQLLVQCLQQGQQGQGMGRPAQLNSQMTGSSGQQAQSGKSSGQHSQSDASSGQHSQSGTSSGQPGAGRSSSNLGSSSSNISGSGSSRNKL